MAVTMPLAAGAATAGALELKRREAPLVVEFTSARVRQRPLASRAAAIDVAGGRLPVHAVDIDAHPELRRRFRIDRLPTFIVLHGSGELARFVGPYSRRELAGAIGRAIDPGVVVVEEPPRARASWNDFTTRLWAFSSER